MESACTYPNGTVYLCIFHSRKSPLIHSIKAKGSDIIATVQESAQIGQKKRKGREKILTASVAGGHDRLEAAAGAGGGEEGLPAQHCHDMR